MRAVVQRIASGRVEVGGEVVGSAARGLLIYLGVGAKDDEASTEAMVAKLSALRIFPDAEGRMSLSALDIRGDMLVVSQFTLYGDVRKGRRPSFDDAMEPVRAKALYEHFVARTAALGLRTETGEFRAHMHVHADVDGPVTILVDSEKAF